MTPIRLLIVDDSLLIRLQFEKGIGRDQGIEVVGTAANAIEAMQKIEQLKPDVLTLDVEMPIMSGIDFLKKLLPQHPIPVVVVSSRADFALDALEAGALDFIEKPTARTPADLTRFFDALIAKIKAIANSKVRGARPLVDIRQRQQLRQQPVSLGAIADGGSAVIAIGASTGGTEAIIQVVKDLPPTTPGVVIVQHMPAGFTKLYAERLDKICLMSVKEAQDGDRVETGKIVIGAGDFHLFLKRDLKGYYVNSRKGEKVSGHCPSVDVLFQSVAAAAGAHSIGVILTGMGADGAKGITEMRQKGAYTIGQDQESCVVYGMPMEAYKLGGISRQLPLGQIGREILNQLARKR